MIIQIAITIVTIIVIKQYSTHLHNHQQLLLVRIHSVNYSSSIRQQNPARCMHCTYIHT